MELLAVPFGLAIGVALGMLGGGGSVLAVPVLVYVLDQDVQTATTVSLVVVTAGALAGGIGQARGDHVCWRHVGALTLVAVPGVYAGTAVGDAVSGDALLAGFALVMLGAAWGTWRKAGSSDDEATRAHSSCPPLRWRGDALAGIAVGFLTGLFGVGGGFILVPTLAIALGLSLRDAIGTSLVIITSISLVGLLFHLLAGRGLDAGVTVSMSAACVVGALGGAQLGGRVPQATLGRGFAVLVIAVAAYLLFASTLLGGPPGA